MNRVSLRFSKPFKFLWWINSTVSCIKRARVPCCTYVLSRSLSLFEKLDVASTQSYYRTVVKHSYDH
ncbi:hypothetical protein K474DRAFT_1660020 [Panus rudis PR-1116 ss-1]|nr:hypothetical protein K474DRAFT_1660020 [Panus rudis PR-1116 ss-1]